MQHKISQVVNLKYVEPVMGAFKFGSEKIPWLYTLINKCSMLWMKTRLTKDKLNRNKIHKQIDVCVNLDHGKGHSRILANFILRSQDDSQGGAQCKDNYPGALGNA
eukprot:12246618-Ditylum_brightwellii.AAC.1